jgi:hypothetical protein
MWSERVEAVSLRWSMSHPETSSLCCEPFRRVPAIQLSENRQVPSSSGPASRNRERGERRTIDLMFVTMVRRKLQQESQAASR